MITKAIIQSINDNNTAVVRIPFFETAGCPEKAICEATILQVPGMINMYSVNDIVFVGFNDNRPNKPTILGRLYLGLKPENAADETVGFSCDQLKVRGIDMLTAITNLSSVVDDIKSKLSLLEERLAALEHTPNTEE